MKTLNNFVFKNGRVKWYPNININERNYNTLNFEPSDDDLKKLKKDKILNKDQN